MKEINILCVEDGSVDVESLEQEGLHDGKVIIYRQGANPPFVLKLKTDDGEFKSEQNKVAECTLIDGYNCSLCGVSQADIRKKYSNFCSNCGAKIKANSQSFYGPFYSLPELNENNLIFATEQEELKNGKAERKVEYEKERLKPTELEVYKRALENISKANFPYGDYEIARKQWLDCRLNQARKELEDESM